ncbi:unnamed protein product [Toxocara canis]|uniref:Pept_C1 domain-containing protein n=1 Tax=Toxocara canis TaxID=6265 RepID=A0A183ULJ8_TOXCA|nr:unnamed protein product [Toxocara canis]
MSDRICIGSNYTIQSQVSAQDLTSCCSECGGCQGGNYGSFEGCKPYVVSPDCGVPCSVDFYQKENTPHCEEVCQDLYEKRYSDDLTKGIYHPFTFPESQELYGHCAKLLGWGEENGEEYWLYMNTWGREWGEDGFFRMTLSEVPEEAVAGIANVAD